MVYIDKYWDQFEPLQDHWHYLAIIVYTIMFVIGLPANMFVIIYYLKNMKNRKTYNYLLVNLMVANIICLSNAPIVVYNSVFGKWMLGQTVCDIYGVCGGLFGFVSIITMALVSVERYLVVKYPLKVLDKNRKSSIVLITATWVYGGVWCILPLFTPNGFVPEGFMTSCTFDFLNQEKSSLVIISMMCVFGFAVPALVTVLFYTLISVYIKSHYSKLKQRYAIDMSHISCKPTRSKTNVYEKRENLSKSVAETATATGTDDTSNTGHSNTTKKGKKKLTAELRLIRSSVIIVMVFCISWIPYVIISLLAQHSQNRAKYINPATVAIPTIFAKSSALINPLIYAFTNQDFLKDLKKRLC